jgi:hypothetical protein
MRQQPAVVYDHAVRQGRVLAATLGSQEAVGRKLQPRALSNTRPTQARLCGVQPRLADGYSATPMPARRRGS